MSVPVVSIVVPTYNRAALLPRALESIVRQTFTAWEIVLVNDGSNDDTHELASAYAARLGDRFVYLTQSRSGASAARNLGIDRSRGRFVAFLDSDDEFLPEKLERQLALFDRCPEIGFVFCDYAYIDLDGVRHPSVFDAKCRAARNIPHVAVAPGLFACTGDLFDGLIREYFIATIMGMVRRDVLGRTIRFPCDQSYAEEWLFYLQVARQCRAGFVDEPLCLHHHTIGSLARTDTADNNTRHRRLLHAMLKQFPDLTNAQRRAVHRNLARAYLQCAYDAARLGDTRAASDRFVRSWRYHASGAAARGILRCGLHRLNGFRTRRRRSCAASQGPPGAVR